MQFSSQDVALDFLQLVVAGKIDEAYEKYVDMNGKHHNAYFPAGFAALRDAMKENQKTHPNKLFTPKHTYCEGNRVAVHSELVRAAGEAHMSVVHMFRIENGKIVEMWDCGMEIPKECPNKDGAF